MFCGSSIGAAPLCPYIAVITPPCAIPSTPTPSLKPPAFPPPPPPPVAPPIAFQYSMAASAPNSGVSLRPDVGLPVASLSSINRAPFGLCVAMSARGFGMLPSEANARRVAYISCCPGSKSLSCLASKPDMMMSLRLQRQGNHGRVAHTGIRAQGRLQPILFGGTQISNNEGEK